MLGWFQIFFQVSYANPRKTNRKSFVSHLDPTDFGFRITRSLLSNSAFSIAAPSLHLGEIHFASIDAKLWVVGSKVPHCNIVIWSMVSTWNFLIFWNIMFYACVLRISGCCAVFSKKKHATLQWSQAVSLVIWIILVSCTSGDLNDLCSYLVPRHQGHGYAENNGEKPSSYTLVSTKQPLSEIRFRHVTS